MYINKKLIPILVILKGVFNMTFYETLTKLMKERNVTAKELSETLKFGKNQIKYWKDNGNIPNGEILISLSNYFDVSIDYLLGRTDNPNETGISVTDNKQTSFTGNNSISINSAVHNKKDTLTEQFMRKFEQLDFDDKVDVMQYVTKKKSSPESGEDKKG